MVDGCIGGFKVDDLVGEDVVCVWYDGGFVVRGGSEVCVLGMDVMV